MITQNDNFTHDLGIGKDTENWFSKLCEAGIGDGEITIEIKTELDFNATTGNAAVEVYDERKGKPSGLSTSEADYQVHVLKVYGEVLAFFGIKTEYYKEIVDSEDRGLQPMGDKNTATESAQGYLIRFSEIFSKITAIGRRLLDGKSRS